MEIGRCDCRSRAAITPEISLPCNAELVRITSEFPSSATKRGAGPGHTLLGMTPLTTATDIRARAGIKHSENCPVYCARVCAGTGACAFRVAPRLKLMAFRPIFIR